MLAFTNPFVLLAVRVPPLKPIPSRDPFVPVSPVAYSLPILGSTFSPALKLTKRANGTSQMQIPKYDAISVKLGGSSRASYLVGYPAEPFAGGVEKCRNHKK